MRISANTKRIISLHSLATCSLIAAALVLAACGGDPEARRAEFIASGDRYAAEGRLAEAIIEYRNAVQQAPSSGEARARLAKAYLESGDTASALREFVRAADLLPDDVDVQVKAGELLLLDGQFDEARGHAERVLARDGRHVAAQILLANSLAGLKDFNAAVEQLQEAIAIDPGSAGAHANLGVLQLGRGKTEEAERAFKKAVELDPDSLAAHLALANFYWVTDRKPEAERVLRERLASAPDDVTVHRAIATFLLASHRAPEAEPHLKKIVEISKTNVATLALAEFYITQGQDASARALLEPLLKDNQARVAARVRLATLDHRAGRRDQAYAALADVLASDATYLQALLTKAQLLLRDNRLDEALAAATAAADSHPDSAAALFLKGWAEASQRRTDAAIASFESALQINPRLTQAKVALAKLHLAKGQAAASVTQAEDAKTSDPRNLEARLVLVDGLLTQRQFAKAASEVDTLLKEFPASPDVHVRAARLRAGQKRLADSRTHFVRALQLDARSIDALEGIVMLDLLEGRGDEARRRVEERLRTGSSQREVLMIAARTFFALKDESRAEDLLQRCIDMDPSYLPAYSALGQLYVKQGRLADARSRLESLVARQERPVGPLTLLGIILETQGDRKGAQARYEEALRVDPNAPVAANNLAWLLANNGGSLDTALQLAETAKRGLPDSPEVNDTLGFIYLKKDLPTLAIRSYKEVLEKDARNPVYHARIGQAYAQVGNTADARKHLSQALRLDPDFEGASEARSALESLQ